MRFESTPSGAESKPEKQVDTPLEHAGRVLSRYEINMNDFRADYPDSFEHDKLLVSEIQRNHDRSRRMDSANEESKGFSEISEALVIDIINNPRSRLFGEGVSVKKCSEFDDLENKKDLVVIFKGDKEKQEADTYLTLDITFSDPLRKIQLMLERMNDRRIGDLKYIRREDGKAGLKDVPHAIAGFDFRTFDELKKLWHAGKYTDLEVHPARFMILEQIRLQAAAYSEYAGALGMADVQKKYKEIEDRISNFQSRFPRRPKDAEFEQDRTFAQLKESVNRRFSSELRTRNI